MCLSNIITLLELRPFSIWVLDLLEQILENFAQQLLDVITGMIFLFLFAKNLQKNSLKELSFSIILLSINYCHAPL